MFAACLLSAAALGQSTVTVAGSGTFDGNAETTKWTAPNASWQFSFSVANPPSASGVGGGFNIASFTNFAYYLGGILVSTRPDHMHLYAGGGWLIDDFDGGDNGFLLVPGTQLYSGPDASPTLLLGTFSAAGSQFDSPDRNFVSSGTFSISPACPVNVSPYGGGTLSIDHQQTTMYAVFVPTGTDGLPMGLYSRA